ncbi:hypothetical protein KUDE01_020263 [Dissostichus eleginoides]|uniref:Uncharacterized protein n=1 Tax=Dissostichus eleginoides TaxID=100907 RepID=A0AAD9C4M4_DISEL|nr:hypothetical protein KUDE01_020263 [Dissostichus eleginoides]
MMLNSTAVCQTHVHTFPATLGAESRARGRQGQDRRGLPVLDALTAVMLFLWLFHKCNAGEKMYSTGKVELIIAWLAAPDAAAAHKKR